MHARVVADVDALTCGRDAQADGQWRRHDGGAARVAASAGTAHSEPGFPRSAPRRAPRQPPAAAVGLAGLKSDGRGFTGGGSSRPTAAAMTGRQPWPQSRHACTDMKGREAREQLKMRLREADMERGRSAHATGGRRESRMGRRKREYGVHEANAQDNCIHPAPASWLRAVLQRMRSTNHLCVERVIVMGSWRGCATAAAGFRRASADRTTHAAVAQARGMRASPLSSKV